MATYSGSDKRLQYLFQHGGGGSGGSLEDLDDVEITNPTDGDALVYDGEEEKWVNGEGGGGNANEQVLTKAEYDALTEEQKMNNTTYYINDADTWTSKEVQPVIYSTEEREIGVWVDGKPLYQKSYTFTAGAVNTYTTHDLGLSSSIIDKIKIENCFIKNTYSGITEVVHLAGFYNPNPYDETVVGGLTIANNSWAVFYRLGRYLAGGELHITVQYTKTTDQPGSGIYTPQGQLAVHYSTDEHVIGTWIDGKPLYEKVIILNNVNITSGILSFATDLSNIDNIATIYSTIREAGGQSIYTLPWAGLASTGVYFNTSDNKIYFKSTDTFSNATIYLNFQYTKTTD